MSEDAGEDVVEPPDPPAPMCVLEGVVEPYHEEELARSRSSATLSDRVEQCACWFKQT